MTYLQRGPEQARAFSRRVLTPKRIQRSPTGNHCACAVDAVLCAHATCARAMRSVWWRCRASSAAGSTRRVESSGCSHNERRIASRAARGAARDAASAARTARAEGETPVCGGTTRVAGAPLAELLARALRAREGRLSCGGHLHSDRGAGRRTRLCATGSVSCSGPLG